VKHPDGDSPGHAFVDSPAPERARPEAVSRLNPGTLPYVLGRDVGLHSSAGRPVWPVTDESELEALRSTVELFDGRLEAIESAALADDEGVRPSFVASFGASVLYPDAGLRPLAELYAHLTSRVAKLAPLDRVGRAKPEIVVCLWEHLDVNALETLQRAAMRRPLGLIVAETPAALRVRLLRCAAAATLAPPARGDAFVFRGSHEDAARPRLAEVRGVLGALVHSGRGDGLDYNLTKHEVLCSVARRSAAGDSQVVAAPCVADGHCYRLHTPMAAARASHLLLDPGELSARAIVLVTCFGVPSSDSLVPPAWSLLEGLLDNPSVACVATSLGIAMPAEADPAAMVEALCAGVRIGDALYRNPRLSREAHERCRMLLFGDPRTRPLRGAPRPPPAARVSPPLRRPARPGSWSRAARLSFLDELIAVGRPTELGGRAPSVPKPADDDTIVERLDGLAPLWDHWTKTFQPPRPTRDPATCPGCGRPGRSFAAEWRQAGLLRVFSTCTRCGVFRDTEPGSELDRYPPQLRGTIVEIPDAVADARVMIRYKDELEVSRRWMLPRGRGRQQSIAGHGLGLRLVPGTGLATVNVVYLLDLEMAAWQLAVATKPLLPSAKTGTVAS
jgi:hypothetical protein